MSAPPELVLLSPYRGNTGEGNIDYSEEEEHTINYGEEEEEVEIILEVEQDFDAQGNTISELKIYYCIQWFKSELVIFPLHELLEFPRHKDLNNL